MKGRALKKHPRHAVSTEPVDCRKCTFERCILFADRENVELKPILESVEALRFASGSALYNTGDPAEQIFVIREGLIKLVQYSADGTQRIVRLLQQGTIAGLDALVDRPYEHTAVTLQPTFLCCIPIDAVHRLDTACPDLHWQLIKRLKGSLHAADEWLTELSTGSARARLARLLVTLVVAADECEVFSRENLGAMLGVTTETASRTMAEFKREGLVTEKGLYRCRCVVEALRKIATE